MPPAVNNDRPNPNPCNLQEVLDAFPLIVTIIENIQNILVDAGVTDTFKVAVNATDVTNVTQDYLHAKLNNHGTYDSDTGILCKAETITNATELIFADTTTIANYADDAEIQVLIHQLGALQWAIAGDLDVGDDKTVLVSGDDTTSSYLHTAMHLQQAYVEDADVLVASAVVGNAGTDQTLRNFVDVSAMEGWVDTGSFVWMTINNETQLVDVNELLADDSHQVMVTSADTTPKYLHDAIKDNATHVTAEDPLVASHTTEDGGDENEQFFLDTSVISGYSDITDGEFWPLGLERSGATRTIKFKEISGGGGGSAKFGKADSTIPARSGNTAGSGTVSVWTISGTTLSDTGDNETWYNISGQSVTAGAFIQAKMHGASEKMIIDFEDC